MLEISKNEFEILKGIQTILDDFLRRGGIDMTRLPFDAAGCQEGCANSCDGGCKSGCDGCRGCDGTSKNTMVGNMKFDDVRYVVDHIDKFGPILFSKEFLNELKARK